MPNAPLVLGEAVMILGADRRALSAAFLAARLEGESTFSRIASYGTVAMVAMGAAAASGIGAAIKAAAGLEFAVSGAGAVAYATTAQLAAMTKQSLQLSQTSTFSATEVAQTMEVMIKAGLSLEHVLNGGTAAAVTLAQAGGTTLAKAGDVVSTAMKVWEINAADVASTVDRVAAAANVSRFDVDDLSRAIATGAGQAKLAGITFDDFMATIAGTSQFFHTGADAGTAFKTFLLRLNPTTKTAREEMQKLGIITEDGLNRFFDADKKIRPMVDVVNVLNETLGQLSPMEQVTSLKKIFGERGIRLATGLVKMTAEEFIALDKYMKSLDAGEIAAARLDNAQGAAQRLLRTMQALGTELGQGFLERIKRGAMVATQELPKVVDALREGLTGKMAPVRLTTASVEVLRTVKDTSEEGAPRGMEGAGPSNMEQTARRIGEAFRREVIPKLRDLVEFVDNRVIPALTNFTQHDLWPKLQTMGQIVGTVVIAAFKGMTAVLGPVVGWLTRHEEILGSLIAGYIAYVAISKTAAIATMGYTRALTAYHAVAKGIVAVQGAFAAGQAAYNAGQIASATTVASRAGTVLAAAQSAQRAAQSNVNTVMSGAGAAPAAALAAQEARAAQAARAVTAARTAETAATNALAVAQNNASRGMLAEVTTAKMRSTAVRNHVNLMREEAAAAAANAVVTRNSTRSTVNQIKAADANVVRTANNLRSAEAAQTAAIAAQAAAANDYRKKTSDLVLAKRALTVAENNTRTAVAASGTAEAALAALRAGTGRATVAQAAQIATAQRNLTVATTAVTAAQNVQTAATARLAAAQAAATASSTGLAAKGGGVLSVIRLLTSNVGLVVVGLAALVTVGVALYKNWDRIEQLFGDFAPVLAVLAGSIYVLITAWTGYMLVTKANIVTQGLLNAVMMANPIGLLIASITALIGVGVVLGLNLDKIKAKFEEVNASMSNGSAAAQTFNRNVVGAAIAAAKGAIPPLSAIINTIDLVNESMDRLNKKPVTGGKPADSVGGRITADDLPDFTGPEGERVSVSDEQGTDWRNAPPSNPNFQRKQGPPATIPFGMKYDAELDALIPDPDAFDFDYEPPPGGGAIPDFDAGGDKAGSAASKKKEEDDRLKNAIESLNTRFFNDLSEEVYKNPNKSLAPMIAKQTAIRTEIARTAQMLMDTLGVDMPTAFERASELVLQRIDDMEKELERGPKVSGFLGWLAAWSDNIKKFDVEPSQIKVGDTYQLNGGLNITPDPDVPVSDYEQIGQTVWRQQKFAKQG